MKITRALFFPVFFLWVFLIAVLVSREYSVYRSFREASGYRRLLAGDFPYRDEWMEIYLGDKRIGYITYSVWDSSPDGYEVSAQSVVRVPAFSGPLKLESTAIIDSRFQLKELRAGVIVPELLEVAVEGAVKDDVLHLEVRSGDETLRLTMDPRRIVFTDFFTPLYALDIGNITGRKKLLVYDPLTGSEVELFIEALGKRTLDIGGHRVECRKMAVTFKTVRCSLFFDKKGRFLFLEGPEDLLVVNELILGKGAGREIVAHKMTAR